MNAHSLRQFLHTGHGPYDVPPSTDPAKGIRILEPGRAAISLRDLMGFGLTGVWSCDDGGSYYIRQEGDTMWWAGLSGDIGLQQGLTFCNVFQGKIIHQTVGGEWADVPRGLFSGSGDMNVHIVSDANGVPVQLQKAEFSGGFGGKTWTFKSWSSKWSADSTQDLFNKVNKNTWAAVFNRETLADARDVIKNLPVVVFGRLQASEKDPSLAFDNAYGNNEKTIGRFFDLNSKWNPDGDQDDGDITTWILANVYELPPDFVDGASLQDTNAIRARITQNVNPSCINNQRVIPGVNDNPVSTLRIHPEIVMYGATDDGPPYTTWLPGWGQVIGANGDSILVNGRPLNGDVVFNGQGTTFISSFSPAIGDFVRVTGALVFDLAHDPPPFEIHPVYAIDCFKVNNSNDLSGTWGTTDGGTCYLRILNNDVWFLWMRPFTDNSLATVFRGTRNGAEIVGQWTDIPLGIRQNSGNLTLNMQVNNLLLMPDPGGSFAG